MVTGQESLDINMSDVLLRISTSDHYAQIKIAPVWGGEASQSVPATQYMYFDRVIVADTDPRGAGDVTPPTLGTHSPESGATGWVTTDRDIEADVNDGVAVDSTSVSMNVDGGDAQTCAAGLTCTWNSNPTSLHWKYTRGGDWANSQTYTVNLSVADNSANTLVTSWQFTTEAAAPVALSFDTASCPNGQVAVDYSCTLTASGGSSPYTYDIQSGTLPTGVSLDDATGVISGTPAQGSDATWNFTGRVTDYLSATDNGALSILVIPEAPAGVTITTLSGSSYCQDTFVNQNDNTYYSTDNNIKVYTWPDSVTANRIFLRWDITSIPSNVSISDAKLRLYLDSMDYGGKVSPMSLWVYPLTSKTPVIGQLNWSEYSTANAWTTDTGCPYGGSGPCGGSADLDSYESIVAVDNTIGWKEFNVTNMVQTSYAGSGILWMSLDSDQSNAKSSNRYFSSTDAASNKPELVITYEAGEGGPPPPTLSGPGKMRINKFQGGSFH
jgi:hypothetical protein